MSFTKKQVMEILNTNDNKKVSTIIPLIEELEEITKTKRQKTYLLDNDNNPFAVFCYYHKQWELLSETEFGVKSSSKTGLNTMCKLGVNKWTKQQKENTKSKNKMLEDLMEKKITQDDLEELSNKIESDRILIDLDGSVGYTFEEITKLLNEHCE